MLITLGIALVVLWALGLLTDHTMGGSIHILLVLATLVVLFRINRGRRLL
jgi:hypothetical protein